MATSGQTVPHTESRIFSGFRCLGHVSNEVPVQLRYIHRRRENFIVTVVGKSFNTYASQKLKHLSVSGTLDDSIKCIAVDTYHVYTGSKDKIHAWRRGTEVAHIYQKHNANVKLLLPMAQFLLAIYDDGNFCMFNIKTGEHVWEVNFPVETFMPVAIIHPPTHMNKVLIASEQGSLEIWNVNRAAMIHHFDGWSSHINQIVMSPAVNIVAVALRKGQVILFDITTGETVAEISINDEPRSMAFRTDGVELIIIGGEAGTITVWDLANEALIAFVEDVHQKAVTGLACFPQEPIFVTSSGDNSLKVWIFDMPDGSFRLLNSRDGHGEPSNKIRFHGPKGNVILSAGQDNSFRMFHIYNETYNRCMSKTSTPVRKTIFAYNYRPAKNTSKMPAILDFTAQTVADPTHHDGIAACHEGQVALSTWAFGGTRIGNKDLVLTAYKKAPKVDVQALCLAISSCAQFVLAGYSDGTVERFNIQSGLHRKTYGSPAHDGRVCGVCMDQLNTVAVSGGSDGKLNFWQFKTGELSDQIDLATGISNMFFHRLTTLIGVVLDDYTLVIVELVAANIFRRFKDNSSEILNACFSPDNRWITASSTDCIVRTWDLPSSKMIDIFRLECIVSSMDYSPNGEFLATALHNNVGILLWMNKSLYVHVSLMPIPSDFLPPLLGVANGVVVSQEEDMDYEDGEYKSPEQIDADLVTLSTLPPSRWKSLINLDLIKKRNKPKEPPKTYVAPFFMSSMTAATDQNGPTTSEGSALSKPEQPTTSSRILNINSGIELSDFATKLSTPAKTPSDYMDLCKMLGEMGPSRIDNEITSLGPLVGGSIALMKNFIALIANILKTNMYFETTQAYLSVFIDKHGDTIQKNDELLWALEEVLCHLSSRVNELGDYVTNIMSFTDYVKSSLF